MPGALAALLLSPAGIALQKRVLPALLGAPSPVLRLLAGGPPVVLDGQTLDRQISALLGQKRRAQLPDLPDLDLAAAREQMSVTATLLAGRPRPMAKVEDLTIDAAGRRLSARAYMPHGAARPAPVVVYYHGGGWVVGDLDSHDPLCRELADAAGAIVIAVDYRLAPEHPFPAAVDDAFAAYRWATENVEVLFGDPRRIAVAGDSAGGNLAAVVCQLARGAGVPQPRLQLLIYPATDFTRTGGSYETFARGFLLERRTMDWFEQRYLGDATDRADPRVSPLLTKDLRDLAPAYVLTAGFDPLRDEGRRYADALAAAGVHVRYSCRPGLVHGFAAMTGAVRAAREAVDDAGAVLRSALG